MWQGYSRQRRPIFLGDLAVGRLCKHSTGLAREQILVGLMLPLDTAETTGRLQLLGEFSLLDNFPEGAADLLGCPWLGVSLEGLCATLGQMHLLCRLQ